MWRTALIMLGAAGCKHAGGWQFHQLAQQSISGPQPFVMLHALGPPSSHDLMIECAPDGLQLSFRGRFSEAGATVRFDEAPPLTLPIFISRRGVPVIDLRAPIEGRSDTAEELLVAASRFAVNAGTEEPEVLFDVTDAGRAIARLQCPTGVAR